MSKAKVSFRFDLKHKEVAAVFSETARVSNRGEFLIGLYVHQGQHSEGSREWVRNHTRAATPEEYADLHAELSRIGYDVEVVKRLDWSLT